MKNRASTEITEKPILSIEAVTVSVGSANRKRVLFSDFSLSIDPGEAVGIFGANGCGKSTLFDRVFSSFYGTTTEISGKIIFSLPDTAQAGAIGYVRQTAPLFPWLSVEKNIHWGRPISGVKERSTIPDCADLFGKRPRELSGGEKQRVALAQSLVARPRLVLLDEPFAAMDRQSRLRSIGAIRKHQLGDGISIAMISHNPYDLLNVCDRIVVLTSRGGVTKILKELAVASGKSSPRDQFDSLALQMLECTTYK